jgi:uncharacterized membrane protein YdjX (TVP38/TMEM64 family)
VRFADYLIGTAIGMAPGITTMSVLGYQIWSIVTKPTLANAAIFLVAVVGWLAVTLGAQALILRRRRRSVSRAQRSMDAAGPRASQSCTASGALPT